MNAEVIVKWGLGICAGMFVMFMGWIGITVSVIPVIQVEISQIKETTGQQVMVNTHRLDVIEDQIRQLQHNCP